MRIATMLTMLFVGVVTQSCRIDMPPLLNLIANYKPRDREEPGPYNFSRSKALMLKGGFRDTLVLGDDHDDTHGINMRQLMTAMQVPQEHIVYMDRFGSHRGRGDFGLIDLTSDAYTEIREAARVVHVPYFIPLDGIQDAPRIASTDNILYILATTNLVGEGANVLQGIRDIFNSNHPFWSSTDARLDSLRKERFRGMQATYATGKALGVIGARITEEGTIAPSTWTVSCGDIQESCFSIIPDQSSSFGSARIAAIAFYLSQLYETEEEVRAALEVCAVDVGEPGVDREYGRGLVNLLCPRVLEREVEIVSQYLQEKEMSVAEGGDVAGTWHAEAVPLEIYLPSALRETIKPTYTGTANGTIQFGKNQLVSAEFILRAEIEASFLLDITATAEDIVVTEGKYAIENSVLAMGEYVYTYTATEDSLYLVRSLTLNEALAFLPGSFAELAGTVTKDLLVDDPIRITIRFAKTAEALLGDFNGDNSVDFEDFLLFVGAFGSTQGDQTYNPWMDLNEDGHVAFEDFLLFASAFSRSQAG